MKLLLRPSARSLLLRATLLPATLLLTSTSGWANSLANIYEMALENDATLKAAEATYRANAEINNQGLSALLPQVSANYSHTNSDMDSESADVDTDTTPPTLRSISNNTDTETESYNLTLNQTLFDLPLWFTFKQGKAVSQQAEAQLAYDQQDLIIRVAEAYFNVLRSTDNLEAAKAEERATQRQLEQTQQRFDVGLIAITDVHEARAAYDTTVVNRLDDEGNLGTAKESLGILTGKPIKELWNLQNDFPVVDPNPFARDEWVQFALKNNYRLKASIFAMEAAQKFAQSKKMEHAPKVNAQIQYQDSETDGDYNFTSGASFPIENNRDGTEWSINLSMPIFTGGRISSQRRQAYEQYNVALQNKINAQRSVVQGTRALHISVVNDVQRVRAREQTIVSTSSALDATQAGYEVGTRNIVDVLDAQRRLYASIRDFANARYDYVINMLKLKRSAGTLTPQDIYDISKWLVTPGSSNANPYQQYLDE